MQSNVFKVNKGEKMGEFEESCLLIFKTKFFVSDRNSQTMSIDSELKHKICSSFRQKKILKFIFPLGNFLPNKNSQGFFQPRQHYAHKQNKLHPTGGGA